LPFKPGDRSVRLSIFRLPTHSTSDQIRFICDKGPLATDTSRTQYITLTIRNT